ncbi:hypothetical protein ACRAWF_43090 [Streptomyces sp. L7]
MTVNEGLGLGATIRAWRERLSPSAVGLPSGRSRRATGLRREELAERRRCVGRLCGAPGAGAVHGAFGTRSSTPLLTHCG